MKTILKNGTIILPDETIIADLCIEGGIITKIEKDLCDDAAQYIDVTGKLILAGAIDSHTHLDLDVGATKTADDFYTGTKAAVAGGTTTIIDFATQAKGHSLKEALEEWNEKAAKGTFCDYSFHMAITDWNEATKNEMKEMINEGISSFKMYMAYKGSLQTDDAAIYEALKESKEIGGLIGFHCENGDLIAARIEENLAKGHTHPYYHKMTRPDLIEVEAINRIATMSKLSGAKAWVVHLSTSEGLKVIKEANQNGAQIVAETCPQYLLLDDSLYGHPDDGSFEAAKYVMSPPLRDKSNQEPLWQGLKDGSIAFISTDHCAFNFKGQKELGINDYSKIPNGGMGLEHRLRLMYTYGVCTGRLTINEMTKLLSYNPAKQFGLENKGSIEVGKDADLVILDPKGQETITWKTQVQDVDYTPYEGFNTTGIIETVFLRGEKVVDHGQVVKTQVKGMYQPRKPIR